MGYEKIEEIYQRDPNRLVTRQEAADMLGLKPETLAKWACRKQYGLRMVKVGSRVRYRLGDVEHFIEENTKFEI